MQTFMTVAECARACKVSRRTVYRWIKRGWLPALRIGGTLRIPTHALDVAPEWSVSE